MYGNDDDDVKLHKEDCATPQTFTCHIIINEKERERGTSNTNGKVRICGQLKRGVKMARELHSEHGYSAALIDLANVVECLMKIQKEMRA